MPKLLSVLQRLVIEWFDDSCFTDLLFPPLSSQPVSSDLERFDIDMAYHLRSLTTGSHDDNFGHWLEIGSHGPAMKKIMNN